MFLRHHVHRLIALVGLATFAAAPAAAQLHVYGPGGPAPAMKEAAAVFQRQTGVAVTVTSGPTPEWIERARKDADIIYSGSDTMMTDFVRQLPDSLRQQDVRPLYDRPAAILVRKGNPKRVNGFRDLARPGLRVMVVEGAGQNGLWEDLASRAGGISFHRALRPNIVLFAKTSADARAAWIEDKEIDAWVIWNIWQIENAALADQVRIEHDILIWRPMAIAVTTSTKHRDSAARFAAFLEGSEGARIFRRHGWRGPEPVSGRASLNDQNVNVRDGAGGGRN